MRIFGGQPPGQASAGPPSALFFSFSRPHFHSFSLSLGVFSWNFGGVLVGRDLKCACFRLQAVLWNPGPHPSGPPPFGPPTRLLSLEKAKNWPLTKIKQGRGQTRSCPSLLLAILAQGFVRCKVLSFVALESRTQFMPRRSSGDHPRLQSNGLSLPRARAGERREVAAPRAPQKKAQSKVGRLEAALQALGQEQSSARSALEEALKTAKAEAPKQVHPQQRVAEASARVERLEAAG